MISSIRSLQESLPFSSHEYYLKKGAIFQSQKHFIEIPFLQTKKEEEYESIIYCSYGTFIRIAGAESNKQGIDDSVISIDLRIDVGSYLDEYRYGLLVFSIL